MSETIAACQLPDVQDDTAATLEQIIRYTETASRQGIDVLCFPECYLQGYTRDKQLAEQRAIELKGAAFREILGRTATYSTTLIIGLIERRESKLYNTAAIIRQGELLGTYRKTHPNENIFEAGGDFPVFTTDELKFGVNICNDANYPEAADKLLEGNPRVIFYPLNNRLPLETAAKWRSKHVQNLIDRATQTKCWVVSSDIVCKDEKAVGYGFTAIVSPEGKIIAQAEKLTEQMITAIV
ncbi:carbon-nitrogen hydrolase family protein [Candidatus Saccharibacteria bacterium]|nr:MAG: carbon-nitrogen hydrolase family protein [Candidatus Saccharibacteria bacterium]